MAVVEIWDPAPKQRINTSAEDVVASKEFVDPSPVSATFGLSGTSIPKEKERGWSGTQNRRFRMPRERQGIPRLYHMTTFHHLVLC